MDNDTLRLLRAAVLGPVFWAFVQRLSDRIAQRRTAHDLRRGEERAQSLYRFGVKLGRLCRRTR